MSARPPKSPPISPSGLAEFVTGLLERAWFNARLLVRLFFDGRVPFRYKLILPAVVWYLRKGRDIIPDDTPVIGRLDDVAIVALGADTFFKGVPPRVLDEHIDALLRKTKKEGSPSSRSADSRREPPLQGQWWEDVTDQTQR